MALLNATQYASEVSSFVFSNFSFAEYIATIKPLSVFVLGISIYAIFVFKFYRLLASKEVIKGAPAVYPYGPRGPVKKSTGVYYFENLIIMPILAFIWFAVIATLLGLLAETNTPQTVILPAIAAVAAIRVCAYYNEDLSRDLAKMIPFAMLGIFLVDASYFSIERTIAFLVQIPLFWKQVAYYILFVVPLEFILVGLHQIGKKLVSPKF